VHVLRTPAAAAYVGLSPSTLEKMHLTGSGPPFVKLGPKAVGYAKPALDDWLSRQTRASTSDRGPGHHHRGGIEQEPAE
jgi:predicted DNA-binding transcriptional regulator AlpA